MIEPWRIELLGWLRVVQGDRSLTRFRSRQHAGLLAYLAYDPKRSHPREALVELLWPESDPPVGRHRLCQALYSLRQQLEPPPTPPGAVFQADRHSLRLNPAACVTDVALFEAAIHAAGQAADPDERARWLLEAVEGYRGELLPGFFEEWIAPERQRLAEAHWRALFELRALREATGDPEGALRWARQAVAADPLREESQRELIRLLVAAGQVAAAQRQYAEYAGRLEAELGAAPDPAIHALLRESPAGTERVTPSASTGAAGKRRQPDPPIEASASERSSQEAKADVAALSPALARGALPLEFTRFFGREREIASLEELLRSPQTRLVTLTGPGGVGKTRLAIQAARRLRDRFTEAVWFAPLVDLADPRLIGDKLLDALHLPRSPNVEPLEQVATFLARQPAFLVLDNLEHLIHAGAPVVQTLLERVETLTCLVTSRQCLNLPAEREFQVVPLPVPALPAPAPARRKTEHEHDHEQEQDLPADLLQLPSVALFVDRAQAVQPDFQVTPTNAAAVAALCARLEGLPLAIELAAARTRVLTVRQMLGRLEQRFELLVSRKRQPDPRHQSLRAALDWSYHLLSPALQRFFVRLAVFRGGWTLEAAAAVCEEPEALAYLEELRECSLVEAVDGGEAMRYRLLETLREFGLERLAADGELATVQRRHTEYFLALAERWEPEWYRARRGQAIAQMEGEHDNVRAALAWSLEQPEGTVLGLRLAGAMGGFWLQRGYLVEGGGWLDRALSLNEELGRTRERAHALYALGKLDLRMGDYAREYEHLAESEAIWRELGEQRPLAYTLILRAHLDSVANRSELERVAAIQEEAALILHREGDRSGLAFAHYVRGLTLPYWDRSLARSLFEESLRLYREEGDRWGTAYPLSDLGIVAQLSGDMAAARSYLEESLSIVRAAGDTWRMTRDLRSLAEIAMLQGDHARAVELCEEGLELAHCMGSRGTMMAEMLLQLGISVERGGDYERARRLFGQSLALHRESALEEDIAIALSFIARCAYFEGDFSEAQFLAEESLGMLPENLVGFCRNWVLVLLAQIALAREEFPAAQAGLEECLANWRETDYPWGVSAALDVMGDLSRHRGEWQQARGQYEESLAIRRRMGDRLGVVMCMESLAALAVATGRFEQAVRLFGATEAQREAVQAPLPPVERREYETHRAALRAALGDARLAAAWAAGRALTLEEAIAAAAE